MSRNLRNKSNATPTKKSAKGVKTASSNYSSDDDYGAVEDISDSEEDEKDVELAESRALIDELSDEDLQTTPRPTQDDDQISHDGSFDEQGSYDDQQSWNGFEDDQDVLGDDQHFFNEHIDRAGLATEDTLYPGVASLSDEPKGKQVRFAPPGSDTSSNFSDDSNFGFPDIFVDVNDLDPSFRKEIGHDEDEEEHLGSSDDGLWDFESTGRPLPRADDDDDLDNISDSSSGTDESGYSTDEGETTEEEEPPKDRYVPARSVLRQPTNESTSEEEEIVVRRTSPKTPRSQNGRSLPRLGTWTHQPDKPYAMFDTKNKRMILFKAKIKSNRRFSFNDAPRLPSTLEEGTQEMSPMISNSANMMISAMWGNNMNYDFLGSHVLGPPEAFYPFTSINANGEISRDSPESFDEDDIDEEDFQFLDMDDLIAFPTDEEGEEGSTSPTDGETASTPRPTKTTSEDQVHPLLMSRPGLVGAFRNNQNNHRILSGGDISQNSLLFSGRFNSTAITGIREGHITAAGTPITPMRKKRAPIDSSPLAAKRKLDNGSSNSGEQRSHKRNKSMF